MKHKSKETILSVCHGRSRAKALTKHTGRFCRLDRLSLRISSRDLACFSRDFANFPCVARFGEQQRWKMSRVLLHRRGRERETRHSFARFAVGDVSAFRDTPFGKLIHLDGA